MNFRTLFIICFCSMGICTVLAQSKMKPLSEQEMQRRVYLDSISNALDDEAHEVYHKSYHFGFGFGTRGWTSYLVKSKYTRSHLTSHFVLGFNELFGQKVSAVNATYIDYQSNYLVQNGLSYLYAKSNFFYPIHLGYGRDWYLGDKSILKGVSLIWTNNVGLSLGLIRPYMLQVNDTTLFKNGVRQYNGSKWISYNDNRQQFVSGYDVRGGSGLERLIYGWDRTSLSPGVFFETALRFEYGLHRKISALKVGLTFDYFVNPIKIMIGEPENNVFIDAHLAIEFGKRK